MNGIIVVVFVGLGLLAPFATVFAGQGVGDITMQVIDNSDPATVTSRIHLPDQDRDQLRSGVQVHDGLAEEEQSRERQRVRMSF